MSDSEAIVGIDFRPSNGQLYALTNAGRLYTLNPATGAASGGVTLSANTLDGTSPNSGVTPAQLFATAFTNAYAGATVSVHYALNMASNSLVRQTSISGALVN